MNVAVFVSGGGTNLQALMGAQQQGTLGNGKLTLVLASNENAYALERAANAKIETTVVKRTAFADENDYAKALTAQLEKHNIKLIVLAGFLSVLPQAFCKKYENRIINVHPSLIPAFCGDGFYGMRVHEQALKKGVKVTGATVHFVTEEVDGGPIIAQKAVPVCENDTPKVLQQRVMEEAEWILLPQVVRDFCDNALVIVQGVVKRKGERCK